MNLFVVIAQRSLLWPEDFPEDTRFRGGEGYVVDMDAPYEREWCITQEAKMRPATPEEIEKGMRPSMIDSPVALRAINAYKEGMRNGKSTPGKRFDIPLPEDAGPAKALQDDIIALRKEVAELREQVQALQVAKPDDPGIADTTMIGKFKTRQKQLLEVAKEE